VTARRSVPSPRRARRAGVVGLLAGLAVGLMVALVAGCSDGSDLGRRSHRPVKEPASGPRRPVSGTGVALAWSEPLAHWPGTLTVHDGQVIVADGHGVISSFAVVDGARGWEVRLDASTGEVLPAVDDDTVLLSAADQFIALERSTGQRRWAVPTDSDPTTIDGRSLALGVALVGDPDGSGAPSIAVTAVDTGVLRGRRVDDGTEVWAVTGDGWLAGPMAVHGPSGSVVVIWRTPEVGLVQVLDGATGLTRWSREIEPSSAAPVIAGDSVIVAAGYDETTPAPARIRSLVLADGRERWSTELVTGFEPYQVPAVDLEGGEVALVDRMGNAALVELATGRLRWRQETDGVVIAGRVALTDGFVAYANSHREVMVLERRTGRVWAKISRDEAPWSVPISVDHLGDRLVVGWRWVQGAPLDAIDLAPVETPLKTPGKRPVH